MDIFLNSTFKVVKSVGTSLNLFWCAALQVTIQCTEISSIRKEKTALVIPNAVQVCTEFEKVCNLMSYYFIPCLFGQLSPV